MKALKPDYFRNLIFGAEDSLVSTVGVMFGVASASYDKSNILLTGLIVIAVESLSMGAGSFLSESSTNEFEKEEHQNPIISGLIMFSSYFFTGFIPLAPYMFFEVNTAKYASVLVTLLALFLLGFLPKKSLKGGMRMTLIAGAAVLLGFLIANLFTNDGVHTF